MQNQLMVDQDKALPILNELEEEYLRIGSTQCNYLSDKTQLSAFLMLGLRSTSLLKSMLALLQPTLIMSGCDVVERAFLEASHLQLKFRFPDSTQKVSDWFSGKKKSWKSDKGKLNSLFDVQKDTGFGREYGDFSASAHPTVEASRSSVALVTLVHGINANSQLLELTYAVRCGSFWNLLFREAWTALKDVPPLIHIPVDRAKLPLCVSFVDEFVEI